MPYFISSHLGLGDWCFVVQNAGMTTTATCYYYYYDYYYYYYSTTTTTTTAPATTATAATTISTTTTTTCLLCFCKLLSSYIHAESRVPLSNLCIWL